VEVGVNRVTLMGRVGRVEFKSGRCSFSVATHERERREEGWVEHTEWHHVVTFGRLAELVSEYVGVGEQVLVEGKLRLRRWEYEGKNYYRTEVVGSVVEFIGRAASRASRSPVHTDSPIPQGLLTEEDGGAGSEGGPEE
jgi:single-strand DNA-binding protein